jgi:oxygen-independent coproporphyrinogen-3 oxidase
VGNSYSQNEKDIKDNCRVLDENKLPTLRGVVLDHDDLLRRHVIRELMCHSRLSYSEINQMFDIDFKSYFNHELVALQSFVKDNLVVIETDSLQITPSGRMLLRNIGMQFDAYLKPGGRIGKKGSYSRLI